MLGIRRGEAEARAVQLPWGEWPGDGLSNTFAGTKVDNTSSLQLLTVYACNRFICDGIATLPVHAYRDTSAGTQLAAAPAWLSQPTVDLDWIAWCTQVLTSLLLDGNAYCWIRRAASGDIDELVPLNPDQVKVCREGGRRTYRVAGTLVSSYDILHVPGVMFPGSEVGLSPVEAARQSIGAGMAAEEFAARFFGQGATTAGVIESQNEVTPDQAKDMARQFARLHGGKNKAHLPAVLPAKAVWHATGVTNEQAQFLQTRQFSAATIASLMFLIDPSELGLSVGSGSGAITYANLEQRNVHKVQTTFLPWLVRLETALSALIRQQNRYIKINVDGLLRADLKTRYESYAIAIGAKFMLPNEARELEDMAPIDGGDEFAEPPAPVVAAPADEVKPADDGEGDDAKDEAKSMEVHVHVEVPDVRVVADMSEARFEPVINVDAPVVNVDAPVVNVDVAAPEVRVDAPVVNVAAPEVTVEVPRVRRTPIRSADGEILYVTEERVD